MDSSTTLDEPTHELTASLAATSATDRCPNCGSRMAPDQRYCIQCGERRTGGGLREALPRQTAVAAPVAVASRRPVGWLNPNSSLIAGVATLLLAMGVGVLIGRSGHDQTPARAAAPQVVTVAAGSGTAAGTTTTSAAGSSSSSSSSKKSSKHKHKSSSSKPAVSGASSVEATAKKNGVKLPPKVVKVGQACDKGAKGCQGGKFTGNFFGGG